MSAGPNRVRAKIALLPGDGIGPEVVAAARRVLDAAGERHGIAFTYSEGLIGGAAIDQVGVPLPEATIEACRDADAVLLGAVGGPRWDSGGGPRPEAGLLGIRRALGLFANVRPVRCRPGVMASSPFRAEHLEGVDFIVVRELTGGIYFGEKRRESVGSGSRAIDVCSYSTDEIARVVRIAASVARSRSGRLLSVDKANVLETSRLWREVTARVVAEEYPDVELTHMLVDNCAMQLILRPRELDVIVTENMFGDILTDEAAALAGSIGLLPSASLADAAGGTCLGLYEPIHGSAPDLAGRGIANPLGTILSAAMLLRHSLGAEAAAVAVESAVDQVIARGVLTPDLRPGEGSASTEEVTDAVIGVLARGADDSAPSASSAVPASS